MVKKDRKKAQAVSSVKKKTPAKVEKSEISSSIKESNKQVQETPKKASVKQEEAAPIMADLSPIGGNPLQNVEEQQPVESPEILQQDSKYNI